MNAGCGRTWFGLVNGLAGALAWAATAHAQGATAPSSAPAAPAELTTEAFATLPFVDQAEISPNGQMIAGLFGIGGEQIISSKNLFGAVKHDFALKVPEGTEADWIRWVNDDNIVVGLRSLLAIDGGERWYVTRLIGVNRVTGKVTKLLWDMGGQGASLIWVANDGSPDVMIAAQNSIYLGEDFWPTVYRVNVEKGSRKVVTKGRTNVSSWYSDGLGAVRTGVGYADNRRSFSLLYRKENGDGFRVIDRANSRKQESLFNPVVFLPGTESAIALETDDAGRDTVIEVDVPTQRQLRTVFTAEPGSEISGLRLSADRSALLGLSTAGSKQSIVWFDPALSELQANFDKSVGDRRARIISFSKDRQRMLVRVDRPDHPGSIYYFDMADGRLQLLARLNDALGTKPLNPARMIHYSARDGLEIEAVLTLPKGREAKALPIVVMPHGGPWGQDTLDYDYWAQFVASRGYAVIQPNFRGSTGYGEEFTRKGEGQMGLAMQDDVSDALRWAVKEGIADPKRACIVGASYGGYAAMWGIAKEPEQYRCAISISGVANIRAEVNDFGNYSMAGKFTDDWKRMTPDFAAVSPINAVARIKAPLMLIHGKRDVTVDHDQSSRMNAKMREAGKTVEFVSLPLADHYFTRQQDRLTLLRSIEGFLARHNPAN
jgi:dipeptidyl aminopeptidase/acylaminoacyl peptidase